MNFYVLIFVTLTMIYSTHLFSNQENSIVIRFKFLISTFLFILLSTIIGLRDALGSDYGSYFLDFTYMQDFYKDNHYFNTQKLDLVYEYLSFFIISVTKNVFPEFFKPTIPIIFILFSFV